MSGVVALAAPTIGPPLGPRAEPTVGAAGAGRVSRDRLELLTTLINGPGVDPVLRGDVIVIPGDHAVFPWFCVVSECGRPR